MLDEARFHCGAVLSHAHVTDVYLLGLAAFHKGKLATFDSGIPTGAVVGGEGAIELIMA